MRDARKTILKIVPNTFEHASRDLREISVLHDLGYKVIVIRKGNFIDVDTTNFYELHTIKNRPLAPHITNPAVNRLVSVCIWAKYVRKLKGDILSCHDLICLFIGWLSTIGIKNKPLLVYDSHEFEYGRNQKRNSFQKWCIRKLEKFLCNRTALNLMVNESIAEAVQNLHHLKQKPVSVRNVPQYWSIDEKVCLETRNHLCKSYFVPKDALLLMYHGGITKGRGIENAIQAISKLMGTYLFLLGTGIDSYLQSLKELVRTLNLEDRVFFLPAVEHAELWKYVGAVDIGLSILLNTCINHYYALPNKFFECIQAKTPVIVSEFPEMKRIVEKYKIGICCKSDDIENLVAAIKKIRDDKHLCVMYKANLEKAKDDLCWENEKEILRQAYLNIWK